MANYLITVIGPTAIGKTALSIQLAQHFNCDIISCDSRQFFKEMAIGTAVPSNEEQAAAQHHFIQHISVFDPYTVGDFERDTIELLDQLFVKNNIQVMVGGSGLYVDAILKGFDDFPDIDPVVREKIRENYEKQGIDYLQDQLAQLDPDNYTKIKAENPQTLQNPQRMMRFVEVCIGSGQPYSSFLNQKKTQRHFTPIVIGLEAERDVMYDRINQRVDLMLEAGLLKEAEMLYPNKTLNALQTVGYRELFSYFDGDYTFDFAVSEIKKNTRRFAKRQMTWFKRTEKAQWFDYNTPARSIIEYVNQQIQNE
ncbi:tRNA (adenosine(37)-N6)-dimethylallyltransferase MiaA [Flavobacterium cerinum]|uniref:tRNA dimethylallyltransferase n=1 Tax=Flavobacterium cerinum TaxID=2502784 RepID=A0ABY5IT82_9FLAO|nr:tRNA (adenosine(37)-N6)-dimethylallyltransferase MiaA [Flavobacterium cerinum]UUC45367.1 tRNA (adenosine(37)-N6)-dimethylallyltransferase MiaA [Flavobacterium cerinum]